MTDSAVTEHAAWIRGDEGVNSEDIATWLVLVIPLDATVSFVPRENDTGNDADLSKGSIFESKEEINIVGGLWHMEMGAEYECVESDAKRLKWICKRSQSCPFQLRASARNKKTWIVHKFNGDHACTRQLGRVAPRKVHMNVIAAYVARRIRRDCQIMKPKAIMEDVLSEFGITILYNLALRARHTAIQMIYGGYVDSFHMLPGYLHMLQEINPCTIVDLAVANDGKFEHLFVALGACRIAYPFMRPVIAVDGTHLKGKNKGILFVAVTKDANKQVFPLAIGVGPIENDISWKWFLSRFKVAYGELNDTLIVSDAHVSIANAVSEVFPSAFHGTCYYHLLGKLKQYGKVVTTLFERAAYTYRQSIYEWSMASICRESESAFQKLMSVGPEKWTRCMCPLPRYSQLTSNAAEKWNGRLLWARRLPICSMLDAIRYVVEKWFDERRAMSTGDDDFLTDSTSTKLTAQMNQSFRYNTSRALGATFNVDDGKRTYNVDLQTKTCSCCEFQLDGMPCSYAIAAILKNGETVYDYVQYYYTREAWIEAYKNLIFRVPHKEEWTLPVEVANTLVLPPVITPLPGRPRTTRRRSATENQACKRCSVCHEYGHTKRAHR